MSHILIAVPPFAYMEEAEVQGQFGVCTVMQVIAAAGHAEQLVRTRCSNT